MGLSFEDVLSQATCGKIEASVSGFDEKIDVRLFSMSESDLMNKDEGDDSVAKWVIISLKTQDYEPTEEEIKSISRKLSHTQMTEILRQANGLESVTEAGKP